MSKGILGSKVVTFFRYIFLCHLIFKTKKVTQKALHKKRYTFFVHFSMGESIVCWLQGIVSPWVYVQCWWTKWKVKQKPRRESNKIKIKIDYVFTFLRTKPSNLGSFNKTHWNSTFCWFHVYRAISTSLTPILLTKYEFESHVWALCIDLIKTSVVTKVCRQTLTKVGTSE